MSNELKNIIHQIAITLYITGGFVRDTILGMDPRDQDFITVGATPEKVVELLEPYGTAKLVGESCPVIKFRIGGKGDEFDISAIESMEVLDREIRRRDFTCNSILMHAMTGEITDPIGGAADLEKRHLVLAGPEVFKEDPLRIIRGIRIATKCGLGISQETMKAMMEAAPLLKTVAPERVVVEMGKILSLPGMKVFHALQIVHAYGAMEVLWPALHGMLGVEQNAYHAHDVWTHTCHVVANLPAHRMDLRVAALFHDLGKPPTQEPKKNGPGYSFHGHEKLSAEMWDAICARQPWSMLVDTQHVRAIIAYHGGTFKPDTPAKQLKKYVQKLGANRVVDICRFRQADKLGGGVMSKEDCDRTPLAAALVALVNSKAPMTIKDLAINGRDLMAAGFEKGKILGQINKRLLGRVIENPELNTKEALLELAPVMAAEILDKEIRNMEGSDGH
jgi:tRNA nucleotidyltransferase (CCA-adding enzyme)